MHLSDTLKPGTSKGRLCQRGSPSVARPYHRGARRGKPEEQAEKKTEQV